jgi:hypothetical protein
MLTCPLCKTDLPAPTPRCPRCQTDISLLADFVTDLKTLLDKADAHRRAGEIAPAVQGYLDVLEVDPTNAEAREALGPVLRAVRAAESVGRPQQRYATGVMAAVLFFIVCCVFFAGAGWSFIRGW